MNNECVACYEKCAAWTGGCSVALAKVTRKTEISFCIYVYGFYL